MQRSIIEQQNYPKNKNTKIAAKFASFSAAC
jgi:hypothetical protein